MRGLRNGRNLAAARRPPAHRVSSPLIENEKPRRKAGAVNIGSGQYALRIRNGQVHLYRKPADVNVTWITDSVIWSSCCRGASYIATVCGDLPLGNKRESLEQREPSKTPLVRGVRSEGPNVSGCPSFGAGMPGMPSPDAARACSHEPSRLSAGSDVRMRRARERRHLAVAAAAR